MSVASVVVRGTTPSAAVEVGAPPQGLDRVHRVLAASLVAVVLVAPFEALRPLLTTSGQSFTTVEVPLLAALAVCAVACGWGRAWQALPLRETLPWAALVAAACLSAAVAPMFRGNALRMAARIAVAAGLWAVASAAGSNEPIRRRVAAAALASGVIVAALVVADFAGITIVNRVLSAFRLGAAVVGAQLRASGPFQYPTIASMYLEIVFPLGLGLLVASEGRGAAARLSLVAALALIAEAVVLTFTRSGLLTLASSLLLVAAVQWKRGSRQTRAAIAILIVAISVELVSSRSAEMLMLRLTSEGQDRWFSAVFDTPSTVTLDTRRPIDVPVTVTNTGRATWDSDAAEPVMLSYHWVANDSDEVVAWEGIRTPFGEPVRPGRSVSLVAQVGGPGRPGRFRLLWDIEQEHRLWFSTEPEALLAFSSGVVSGPVTSTRFGLGPKRIPRMAVRPGRLILWSAALRMLIDHPWLGVGPDNYRLLYGRYSTLKVADPRVHSNNMYIELIAGTGLVGAAALVWLGARLGAAAMAAARSDGIGAGIAAACLAIATHGLADSFLSFTGTYILIAVTLGLASGCALAGQRHAHRI
ncbi:MAG TPA: O-antigen ligase family protein [Vicinamibacterales bacterium]|nr:O-antigen ligase family protein [Vicinamibacterales bacterium]